MNKIEAKNRIRRNRILRMLQEEGELSISDLSLRTGMSIQMVKTQVAQLRRAGLTQDAITWDKDKVGRPPVVARLRPDAGYVLGIDIGHRTTKLILLNLQHGVASELQKQTGNLTDTEGMVEDLTAHVREIAGKAKLPLKKILGVGISIPGIVKGREGRSETYLNFGEGSIKEVLEERWKLRVLIEHDAKAMAMGEHWFGAARNLNHVLCVNVGWGLGLGIIANGTLFYGKNGYAGEFGHIPLAGGRAVCVCGKTGCLETVASGRAIAERATNMVAEGRMTLLQAQGIKDIQAEHVINAALAGDSLCGTIVSNAGAQLGKALGGLVNLFNPEMIILGGRIAGAGDILLGPMRTELQRHALPALYDGLTVAVSSLGPGSGALGVAALASHSLFEIDQQNATALI